MESTRCRAVLLVDEAQEMTVQVLSELRLLSSAHFDSQSLLCIVMAGDARLQEKLRREELVPLGSRIRTRLATEFASRDELLACLAHLLAGAGNASLMTVPLQQTLCDHAGGNYRILTTMAAELLAAAAQKDLAVLDEKLYLEVFAPHPKPAPRRAGAQKMRMKKIKHNSLCPLCACTHDRALSTEAAVQVLELLQALTENFMTQYDREITRYYAKRAKRNINVHQPWHRDCTDDLF